jgi:hypothetical protein
MPAPDTYFAHSCVAQNADRHGLPHRRLFTMYEKIARNRLEFEGKPRLVVVLSFGSALYLVGRDTLKIWDFGGLDAAPRSRRLSYDLFRRDQMGRS